MEMWHSRKDPGGGGYGSTVTRMIDINMKTLSHTCALLTPSNQSGLPSLRLPHAGAIRPFRSLKDLCSNLPFIFRTASFFSFAGLVK